MSDAIEPEYPKPEEDSQNLLPIDLMNGLDRALIDERMAPVTTDDPDETEAPHQLPFPVVGIGASAGGVEAYIELFQNLPTNTGMAFVVVPHLSADAKSFLPEIIARHTAMDTIEIENGLRPQPNRIYFLPPKVQVSIKRGVFHLKDRVEDGAPRPIDFFFRSLATDQKNRAIGIVLSGMDSDGALGLKAIKGEGGIAMVQSPESAKFPDMPRSSISADHVDIVLPPGQIAFELAQLSRQFETPDVRLLEEGAPPSDEQQLARIITLLRGVSGVDFRMYKPSTIRRRIARRMLLHRIGSLTDYVGFLQQNPKEIRDLQEDALINVTRFFRDPEVFEALKNVVFPQTFQDREPDQQVRIWVAGCSSGEEVYSIAMCLLEYLTGNPVEPTIQIFGTDASEQNIQRARAGIYPEAIVSEVSADRIRRFFIRNEKGYQVAKRVRDLCIFARQNLCHDPPFSRMDLICCRNVLIYFGAQLQKQLIPTFHYALRPNGFLLLGTSETIREFTDLFALTDRRNKIFSKIGASAGRALTEAVPRLFFPETVPTIQHWQREGPPRGDIELQRAADRIVLARYAPPGVIIDETGEILQSRGQTSQFLQMAPGAATLQVTRMARESIAPQVTAAVRRAIEENIPVQVQGLEFPEAEHIGDTTLEILPIPSLSSRLRYYLVLFVPSEKPISLTVSPSAEQLAQIPPEDKDRLISQLRHDLGSTKLYLRSLLEERDGKNQELVSANEEIQSANEELQSTNEELETTKEELQSSNEELQTVNDELQNRNSILSQASNDLSNLLNSVNLPVLMLSNEFNIRHFTPPTQRLMNLRSSDIGRPFGDIRLNLNIDDLEPLFTEVLESLAPREIEVQDRDGHWYLLRVRPYRTTDHKIEGLVVVLVDIDQLRRVQQELRDARDFARSVIKGISLPLAVLDEKLKIRFTNEAFCGLTGSTDQLLEHRFFPDLAAALWGLEQPFQSRLNELRTGGDDHFGLECRIPGEQARVFQVDARTLQPDGERFLLLTFEDISAHKEIERLLKAEGERLANKVDSATKELDRSQHELRALTGGLFTAQEAERRRVARELHDDISQRLAAIDLDSNTIEAQIDSDPESAKEKLRQLRSDLEALAAEVRRVSHRLHPSMLEDLGLRATLRSLVEEFGQRERMITTFSENDVPEAIPLEVSTNLYRITQEALRNVAKHAGRTHIKVYLRGISDGIQLQIVDSGLGFDPADGRSGLGLISMEERARLIGGTLQVKSALGKGTSITVSVPLRSSGNKETSDATIDPTVNG